jgi:hypothetical protein
MSSATIIISPAKHPASPHMWSGFKKLPMFTSSPFSFIAKNKAFYRQQDNKHAERMELDYA